jgi:ABC-type sugar transport system substrate-binding protein
MLTSCSSPIFREIPARVPLAVRLARHGFGAVALSLVFAGSAFAADALNIVFTTHAAPTNAFWQAVKLGFDDACSKVGAKGQFVFTQEDGSIEQQVANMQAVVARKPDAMITSLVAFLNSSNPFMTPCGACRRHRRT